MKKYVIAMILFLIYVPSFSEDKVEFTAITKEMDVSINKSLRWLAGQQRADGYYSCGIGNRVGYGYDAHFYGAHVGVTAIAGMAFLANGHVPGVGPYGKVMEKIVKAVVSAIQKNGYITLNHSRMYSHSFATLFLAEVYGMTMDKDVKKALIRSVNLIVKNQNKLGGWRYNPEAADSDLSVVVCLVQALRAANNAGIYVSRSVIDNSLKYIKSMVYKKEKAADVKRSIFGRPYKDPRENEGGFYYQEMGRDGQEERVTFAICAAGVTALHGTGIYEGRELEGGYQFLKQRYMNNAFPRLVPVEGYAINRIGLMKYGNVYLRPRVQNFQFFYGHYYAVQAFHQKGGRDWRMWFSRLRKEILSVQYEDGHYMDEVGECYATAMATLILSLPKGYLPIFQR